VYFLYYNYMIITFNYFIYTLLFNTAWIIIYFCIGMVIHNLCEASPRGQGHIICHYICPIAKQDFMRIVTFSLICIHSISNNSQLPLIHWCVSILQALKQHRISRSFTHRWREGPESRINMNSTYCDIDCGSKNGIYYADPPDFFK